jgi:hypothetical protein
MLSRFSSLFIYAVAGLVISAAAKPMGHLNSYDDGPKPPSPPGSPYSPPPPPPPKYPADKPYAKPYPPPDNSYNAPSQSENNCNVGQQHCCNPINKVNHPEIITSDDSLLICCFRTLGTPTRVTLPCSLAFFQSWRCSKYPTSMTSRVRVSWAWIVPAMVTNALTRKCAARTITL